MPELPDLQVFSQNLDKKLSGKKLQKVNITNSSKLNTTAAVLHKTLEGQVLKKVYREGKELYFKFGEDDVLSLHLMLHGSLHWLEEKRDDKNIIVTFLFDDAGLVLTDWQKAATPTLNPETKTAPDALSAEINFSFLKPLLAKKRTNIKNFLMDQKILRGIGNAYADEILWAARISPFSACSKIPDEKIKLLAKEIKSVLKDAIEQIKKLAPDSISGEERSFLNIHNSKKKNSPTGKLIHNTQLNGRITYYTDEQELFE